MLPQFHLNLKHSDFKQISEMLQNEDNSPQTLMFRIVQELVNIFKAKGCDFPVPTEQCGYDQPIFPLPFLSTKVKNKIATSSRLYKASRQWANLLVYHFNSQHCLPRHNNKKNRNTIHPYSQKLPSAAQKRVLTSLERDCRLFIERALKDDISSSALIEEFIEGKGTGGNDYLEFSNEPAQRIVDPHDIDLPPVEATGGIPQSEWAASQNPLMRKFLDCPSDFITGDESEVKDTKMLASPETARALVDKLADAGLVQWLPSSQCYPAASGAFCVSKSNSSDLKRLIINLKSVNSLWEKPGPKGDLHHEAASHDRLPNPEDLKFLLFPLKKKDGSPSSILINKADVSAAFYNLSVESQLQSYFSLAVQSPEKCASYPSLAGANGESFKACFSRLPMGFIFSVFAVQTYITRVSISNVEPQQILTKGRTTRGPAAAVIIDDVFSLAAEEDREVLLKWWEHTQEQWRKSKIPTQTKKNCLAAVNQELMGWLLEKSGRYGLSTVRLQKLIIPSLHLMSKYLVSTRLRSRVVGKMVGASLARRQMLALFDHSFGCYTDDKPVSSWTNIILQEHLCFILYAPFAWVSLTLPYSCHVMVSDAARQRSRLDPSKGRSGPGSEDGLRMCIGMGAGYGFVCPAVVEKICVEHVPGRDEMPVLNSIYAQYASAQELEDLEKLPMRPVKWSTRSRPTVAGPEPYWFSQISCSFYSEEIIVIGEAKAMTQNIAKRLHWVNHILEDKQTDGPTRGGRVLTLVDSSPLMFAANKGRSSCRNLNFQLRLCLVYSVCANEVYHVCYIRSCDNWWADAKSRSPMFAYLNRLKYKYSGKTCPAT